MPAGTRAKFIGRHLMLKGAYVEKILCGEKRATIRRGIVKPKYNEITIHAGGRPVAKARISRVYYKKLCELGDYEAKLEGYSSREELIRELRRVYKGIRDDEYVTVIEFEVTQRLNKLPPEEPYLGLKPVDIARIALRYIKDELRDFEIKVLIDLTRTNSIRATAMRVLGDVNKRAVIRKIIKKALRILVEKGLIKRSEESEDNK
jgi:hypothetical protein